jgi:hypothetical protein
MIAVVAGDLEGLCRNRRSKCVGQAATRLYTRKLHQGLQVDRIRLLKVKTMATSIYGRTVSERR